jgi:hypothetical protein
MLLFILWNLKVKRNSIFRVVLVRTNVSEEEIASIIWVKRISERGTALAVNGN